MVQPTNTQRLPVRALGWRFACAWFGLLSGCQTTAAPDLALDAEPQPIAVDEFPAPAHLLRGFDQVPADGISADREWRCGDEALFGLRLRRGGDVRHWLLQLRVLEPVALGDEAQPLPAVDWSLRINGEPQQFESQLCRVEATVMDEYGAVLGQTQPLLPRDFLARGIADACRLVHRRIGRSRGQVGPRDVYRRLDVRPLAEATVSAVALLQVVQQDDVLSPLLWQVIEKPSLWSLIGNLGATVVVRPRFHAVSEALSPVPGVSPETWRLPIALYVNDAAALYVDLFVADPAPPLALVGGVLGATARHPSDAGVEFSLILLSARRGP